MKQEPEHNLDKHPKQDRVATHNSWWRRIILTLAILFVGGAGSGIIYGWYFVRQKLVPLIQTEASNYLHRPLELGELRSISLTGAKFGESALPATDDNPDFVKVRGVKVNFAPIYFLRTRRLKIDIILLQSDVYIEQDESKTWTPTNFGSDEESEGGIKVDVTSIQLHGGQLSLVAYNSTTESLNPTVRAKIGKIVALPKGELIKFDADAELVEGGKFVLEGKGNLETDIIEIQLNGDRLDAREVSNLLALPIELEAGNLDSDLDIVLTDAPVPLLYGELDLDRVTLQIPNLVKPFSNSNGKIAFQGSQITLTKVATDFGEVDGKVSGQLNLAGEGVYELNTEIKPVEINKVVEALELEVPVPLEGKIQGDLAVGGNLERPIIAIDLTSAGATKIDRVDFKQIDANLELIDTTLSVRQFTSQPKSGGEIAGNGQLQLDDLQEMAFNLTAKDVSGQELARSYDNELPVDIGRISGKTNLTAQAGDLGTLRLRGGKANFALGNGRVDVDNLNYEKGIWQTDLTTSGVEFGSLPFGSGSAETIAQGRIDGKFQVAGTSDVGNLDKVDATGQANLDTVGGQILLPKIALSDGTWSANLNTSNLKLQRLFPDLPNELNDNLDGEFYLTGNIPDAEQPQTLINGFGDLILAEGEVKIDELEIVDENWTAIATGDNLKLKELSSATPEQFAGLVNGKLNLAGTTDNITPQGIIANGEGSLTLPEGVFSASQIVIADGKFKAETTPQQVDLSLFADPNSDELDLKGKLGGNLTLTGQVDNLSPTAVSAKGEVSFSQGIDLLEEAFSAQIAWDGRILDVKQAQGNALDAKGKIELDPSFFSDIPDKLAAVDYFEFAVERAQNLDITKLRVPLPSWAINLDYEGRGDFSGRISGIPAAMQIGGNINLKDFQVEEIDFDPLLTGQVQISPETGVDLSLTEVLTAPLFPPAADLDPDIQPLDKIRLVLDRDFAPQEFAIAQDYVSISGEGEKELLSMTAQNIPVDLIKTIALKSDDFEVPENIAIQPIDGELSGDFVFNLNTLATSGENVTIESPALASIRGDLLKGNFQFVDGYFAVQDGEFIQRNSTYKLEGNIKQEPDDFSVDGRVAIDGGQIQDILVALQIFELTDLGRIFSDRNYGNSADLYSNPQSDRTSLFDVGLQDAAIFKQLELLAEIQAWLEMTERERQTAIVPPIKNLQGKFDGEVAVSGSLNEGLTSEFEFLGEKWRWGNLVGRKIVAKGNLKEGILTLLPISIQLENPPNTSNQKKVDLSTPTLLFTGTFGGENQSGQFRLVEVPVKLIEQLFSLPPELSLDGLINASASLAGTQKDPQARGEIRIDNASLNDTSIESTKGSFSYRNARLKFSASSNIVEDADPLILRGSIPYQLPFSEIQPESDRLELQLNVKDKGLALLDIFSRGELKWIDGEGEIVLDLSGVLDAKQNLPRKLIAEGTAKIKNATVAIKNLPNNLLTNINSEVFFDLSNIRVNSFTGDFGGGQILAAGTMPLSQGGSRDPLTIDLDNITVDVPKFYDGGVKGRLQIVGKVTEPIIAGNVTLFDGTILLVDESDAEVDSNPIPEITTGSKISAIKRRNTEDSIAAITQYKNLKLKLGEDIQISQPPIFTFLATGDLNINGTFIQPNPEGTITLQRGQVNLFTTQLNLSRDYQNTARFSSNNVLDPFLDILLVGSAIETTGSRTIPSEITPTEKPDASSLGTLETVRIEAKVKGIASNITNRIELTSSPPRSQAEIVALLGGGFVETLANNTSTFGLASLAGSALFGSLNSEFNNAFPIGELRLFPTQIINDEDNPDDGTDEGIAGEIAFNLFNNFSFSVLKILNVDDIPTQFGFRYRLNKYFVLRGSSDFKPILSDDELAAQDKDQGNTRFLIEFESRF